MVSMPAVMNSLENAELEGGLADGAFAGAFAAEAGRLNTI